MSGFVDEAQLHVKAGDGGAGAIAFRREAHVAKGGPDGGDGGSGGDVWVVASTDAASLLGFRDHPHRQAGSGTHGSGKGKHGRAGADLEVPVPEGTIVRSLDGSMLVDLAGAGERWRAAAGGQGGRGNARFLSNRRRAPSFAEQGEVGEERWLNLELKLMADVALVGLPNAGKSTLISRISAARPKIADYPFTTLEPHLGVVRAHEYEYVVADIPGLIEGASEGRGLGHQFLRHVERARVLVVLVDLASVDAISPQRQEEVLLSELGAYRPELLARPRLVVGSKADQVGVGVGAGAAHGAAGAGTAEGGAAALAGGVSEWAGRRISAVTGEGIPELIGTLGAMVAEARAATAAAGRDTFVIHRPAPAGVVVERSRDGAFVVRGRPALRAVALSDLGNAAALAYAQGRLRRLGIDRALSRAGARQGDLVRIGTFEFEYEPDQ
ncbi:MAG: GTPase ObgE [Actinomycetota bacterium]|nr:GTPase ObgE [Actinomycetota bacterium]